MEVNRQVPLQLESGGETAVGCSSLDDDGEVVTQGPGCVEGLKRKRTFSLERIEDDDPVLAEVNDNQRVDVFRAINRAKV